MKWAIKDEDRYRYRYRYCIRNGVNQVQFELPVNTFIARLWPTSRQQPIVLNHSTHFAYNTYMGFVDHWLPKRKRLPAGVEMLARAKPWRRRTNTSSCLVISNNGQLTIRPPFRWWHNDDLDTFETRFLPTIESHTNGSTFGGAQLIQCLFSLIQLIPKTGSVSAKSCQPWRDWSRCRDSMSKANTTVIPEEGCNWRQFKQLSS